MAARQRKKSNLEAARQKMYRELIFECAERVFALQGFEASTMQEVAAEAGISLKTLYQTFPGKSELYQGIQRVRGQELLDAVRNALSQGGPVLERLMAAVRAYVAFLLSYENFLHIHVREGRAWGLGPGSEVGIAAWLDGLKLFADLIRKGTEEGLFYEGDAELMAMTGIAVMQVQVAGLIARHPAPRTEQDTEEISREIERQLVRLLSS